MKSVIIYFVWFLFISVSCVDGFYQNESISSLEQEVDCSKKSYIEGCIEKLILFGRGSRKWPESQKQLKEYCRKTESFMHCLKDYSVKCAKGIKRQASKLLLSNVEKNNRKICSNNKSENKTEVDLVQLAPCANLVRNETKICMENYLTGMAKIRFIAENLKVSYLCCSFSKLVSCVKAATKRLDHLSCKQNLTEAIPKYINSMHANTHRLLCSNTSATNFTKCQKLAQVESSKNNIRLRSFVSVLIKVLESYYKVK